MQLQEERELGEPAPGGHRGGAADELVAARVLLLGELEDGHAAASGRWSRMRAMRAEHASLEATGRE